MQNHYTPDDKSSYSIPNVPGIYKIVCVTTGRFYVGSAIDLRNRWSTHLYKLRRNIHPNAKLQASWNKHGGEQSFMFEVLEFVMFPEMLIEREQHYIDTLSPFGKKGFNLAPVAGSSLGRKHTPEALAKMSKAGRGRKFPPEFGQKITQRQLGKKFSPERCKNIGDAQRGKPRPEQRGKKMPRESVEKRRQAMIGYKHTEEAKRNMAKAQTGRVHSPESIEKRRMKLLGHAPNNAKEFIVTSPEGVKYLVYHLRNFCKQHGLSAGTLIQVARGNREHHKRWKACYLNPNEDTSKKYSASDEARAKMSAASSTRVRTHEEYASRRKTLILTSPDGVEYVVDGIREFCLQHGLDSSSIAKVARGRYAHHHGWLARFPDEEAS